MTEKQIQIKMKTNSHFKMPLSSQEFRTISTGSKDITRIADALERIASILESNVHINIDHAHIDEIDHNHVEGKIHTHEDKW